MEQWEDRRRFGAVEPQTSSLVTDGRFIMLSGAFLLSVVRYLEGHDFILVFNDHKVPQQGIKRLGDFKEEWKEIVAIYQFITREENGKLKDRKFWMN